MTRLIALFMCAVIAFSLTDCSVDGVKQMIESLGTRNVTADEDLIGIRICAEDGYFSGEYYAECFKQKTKESIFGGASLDTRTVVIKAKIESVSGEVVIRVRENEDVFEFKTNSNGEFEQEFSFESGGNYIMLVYNDFSGTIQLTVSES